MQDALEGCPNLEIREGSVFDLVFEDDGLVGGAVSDVRDPGLVVRGVQLGVFICFCV